MGRVEYLVCPLCGLNRVVRSHKRAEKGKVAIIRFDRGRLPEIENMMMLQIREGGGKQTGTGKGYPGSAKGIGFRLVESFTLQEIMQDPEYKEILEDLKTQYIRQLKGFIRIGFIKKEEIE